MESKKKRRRLQCNVQFTKSQNGKIKMQIPIKTIHTQKVQMSLRINDAHTKPSFIRIFTRDLLNNAENLCTFVIHRGAWM